MLSRMLATDYLACSKAAAEYFFGKRRAKKAVIIPNAVDLSRFHYVAGESHGKRIGYVARFEEVKNHIFLLEVAEKLH